MTSPSRLLRQAARRFADANSDRFNDLAPARLVVAEVVTVTAGAAVGGGPETWVRWRGSTVLTAGKNAAYTPVVGHTVRCSLHPDGQLFIDYRIDGQPTEV